MSNRILNLLAYVTGARGPLRAAFDWLRGKGVGERVIKSALAAVLAYWLARFLPGNPNPILAPLTAIFSINLTIAGSMKDAWQRILGVLFGILFAWIVFELIGPGSVAIGIIIVASFYAGRRLGLEASGVQQLAVSTLLVVLGAAGTQLDNVAILHLANTLIGTGVGLLLNASVAPPNHVPRARQELDKLGHGIEAILDDLRLGLRRGIDHPTSLQALYAAREVVETLHAVDTALQNADESLTYNLMGKNQREVLRVYRRIGEALEHSALQTRIIARALTDATSTAPAGSGRPDWLEPSVLGEPLAELLDEVHLALQTFLLPLDEGDAKPVPITVAGMAQKRQELNAVAKSSLDLIAPDGWILLGAIVALSTQLVTDLSAVPTDVVDPETGRRLRWWQDTIDTFTWWRED
ncbi:MAG: FUSC family protein [Thermomicrobiales bacterium]|nr:FUSC family protein [Thermomicrobiales bacterium]